MRRRFQFSIRALLVLTFLVSLPYGWHAWRQRVRDRAYWRLNAFRALGGTADAQIVTDENEEVSGDGAMASPRFYFIALHLADSRITDKQMSLIEPLTTLKTLDLRRTRVTNAGLRHLKGLKKLRALNLEGTRVTDTGVAELAESLPHCDIRH